MSFSWIVLAVLLVVAVVALVRTRPVSRLDAMLVALCVLCSVWSWRTVPVSALLLVPTIAVLLGRREPRSAPPNRVERMLVLGGTAVALLVLAVTVPFTSDQPPAQPSWVDPALSSLRPGTKVVDAWDWGGYLMWRHPQLDMLMHGYGDTFTVDELQRNTDIQNLEHGWEDELRRTGCTIAVVRPDSVLAKALVDQEQSTCLVAPTRSRSSRHLPARLRHPLALHGSRSRTTASARRRPSSVSTSLSAASSTRPRCTSPATSARPRWSSASTGSPSRSRISSSTRSTRRVSVSSVSRAAAGLASAASRPAYAAGCLTFHHRTPPTWLCAPGPIPHQCPLVQ